MKDKEYQICQWANKRCYTQRDASSALKNAKRYARSTVIPRRSYHCKYCGFWHLTSSDNYMTQERHKPIKILNPQEEFDLSEVL